jgi:GNAT superfamily N-acetyltransferase
MIYRVLEITEKLQQDCCKVVNASVGNAKASGFVLQEWLNKYGFVMFVAEENNNISGFILGHQNYDMSCLQSLFVDKKCQRHGIGTALLKAYEEYSVGRGVNRIVFCHLYLNKPKNFV